jgi:hypothetical protein
MQAVNEANGVLGFISKPLKVAVETSNISVIRYRLTGHERTVYLQAVENPTAGD